MARKHRSTLTQVRLKEVLHYDPETGIFTRKITVGRYKRGEVAGSPSSHGYIKIMVDGVYQSAHQLAWFYVYGEFPESDLDHKNRNRADNRIENLRKCDDARNAKNAGIRKTNRSGYKGVSWKTQVSKWVVQIQVDGVKKHVGYFTSEIDAAKAYDVEARRYFGEFAVTNFEE